MSSGRRRRRLNAIKLFEEGKINRAELEIIRENDWFKNYIKEYKCEFCNKIFYTLAYRGIKYCRFEACIKARRKIAQNKSKKKGGIKDEIKM